MQRLAKDLELRRACDGLEAVYDEPASAFVREWAVLGHRRDLAAQRHDAALLTGKALSHLLLGQLARKLEHLHLGGKALGDCYDLLEALLARGCRDGEVADVLVAMNHTSPGADYLVRLPSGGQPRFCLG